MPLEEKIKAIKRGKKVRPPKAWWDGMRRLVRRDNPGYPGWRISKITAGIWHDYSPEAQINIIRKLQRGTNGVP